MRKSLLSLVVLAISFISFNALNAEGQMFVGYCDGQIATSSNGTVTGQTGSNATIGELIRIPGSMIAPFKGLQLTGVRAGLPEASSYPETLTGWIAFSKDGDRITTGTLSAPSNGWNFIPLASAYTITGEEEELWIGFEFVQSKKLNVISFVGETNPDACWIRKNDNYTDFSSRNLGSLSVEGAIEGDNLPQHNLSIVSASTLYTMTQVGNPIKMKLRIVNSALVSAERPVLDFSINGNVVYSYTYPGTLNYRDKADLQVEVPTETLTEEGDVKVDIHLKWADGTEDEFEADNNFSVTTTLSEKVFLRVMVTEEATGAWCGYCVRGLVGMAYMRENYPETFIGIGVHNGDEYVVSSYDYWMGHDTGITGYPSAVVNRTRIIDPNSADMESYLKNMYPFCETSLNLAARLVDESTVKFEVALESLVNNDNAQFDMAFVLLEDKLPINQSNYYSGGGLGPMGGFENLPSHCDIEIDDVARAIYPSVKGSSDFVPSKLVRGEVYNIEYEAQLPAVANGDNVWAAVLLLNHASGEIVQAAKVASIQGLTGIQQVRSEAATGIEQTFDLQGRPVSEGNTGLIIRNGRISFQR